MTSRNKPNALFWIIILTISSAVILLIYSLILIFADQANFLYSNKLGDLLGAITSMLILLSCYLFIRNHKDDLYGLPRERKFKK